MDGKKQKVDQQYRDMAVSILLDCYTELDVNDVIQEYQKMEDEGEAEVSDALIQKCCHAARQASVKAHSRHRVRGFTKTVGKAAMLILILAGLAGTAVVTVEAARKPIATIELVPNGEFYDIIYSGDFDSEKISISSAREKVKILEKCLPEDYTLAQYEETEEPAHITVKYRTVQQGYTFHLSAEGAGSAHIIHSSVVTAEPTLINGEEVHITADMAYWYRAWWMDEEEGLFYFVRQNGMDKEEFIEILEKIIT